MVCVPVLCPSQPLSPDHILSVWIELLSMGPMINNDIPMTYCPSFPPANKDGESGDSTLLVTLEINDTVFQGVLFAKPHPTISPSR